MYFWGSEIQEAAVKIQQQMSDIPQCSVFSITKVRPQLNALYFNSVHSCNSGQRSVAEVVFVFPGCGRCYDLRPIVYILPRDVDGGVKGASVWCPSREKHHKLLHEVLKPEAKLQRAGRGEVEERHFNMNSERKLSAGQQRDVQKVIVGEEHQQEWSSSLDQEDTKPPNIKEEQEELQISQDEEQLQGLEKADITKFPFTPVPVKSEDDEEKPEFSQLHQRQTEEIKTEAGGEDCGGPEPAMKSDPDTHLQPDTDDQTGDSSEPETDDSVDWKDTREPQSGLNSLNDDRFPVSDSRCTTGEKTFSCSECGKIFGTSKNLKRHMRTHKGEKAFSCSECGKRFGWKTSLERHMITHTGEKPFSCSVCQKTFTAKGSLKAHMRIHTGEKPFSCSVCKKTFTVSGCLQKHMRIHTGEKPFSCSICQKAFTVKESLKKHMRIHTGEKPFSCSVCKKAFTEKGNLQAHMRTQHVSVTSAPLVLVLPASTQVILI
ncbi:zinc finger protein 135-like [Sander lucioperca]|uniref:zinc finger protein 135-like n=1 Tax=Sander lucioperca TaxID=283035 RepID=UPI001653BF65|nr:zinc finger protein 135-like [Sander lucioperca]